MKKLLFLSIAAAAPALAAPADKALNLSIYDATDSRYEGTLFEVSGNNGKVLGISGGEWALITGGSGAWGGISGTLTDQTDLNSALALKAPLASPTFTGTVILPNGTVTNAMLFDADLSTYAGITPSANVQSLLGAADYSAMRTQLSLVPGTNVQAYDADLTTYAGITPSANMQTLLAAADYSAMRTQLSLVPGTNVQAYHATLLSVANSTYTGDDSITTLGTLTGNLLFTDNTYDIGGVGATRPRTGYFGTGLFAPKYELSSGIHWTAGAGTPEGSITGSIGALYSRNNGGDNTTLYIKASGSGNTGWLPALTSASGVGDVTAASGFGTDNLLVRSDGTGKGVQSSGWSLADTGALSISSFTENDATALSAVASGTEGRAITGNASGTDGVGVQANGTGTGSIALNGVNATLAGTGVSGSSQVSGGIGVVARADDAGAIPLRLTNSGGFHVDFSSAATADRGWQIPDDTASPNIHASRGWVAAGYQPLDTQLTDFAALAYATNAGKVLAVNGTEDGLEFVVAGSAAVATDTIWDAAGDTVYGTGANTASRLAIGTEGQLYSVSAGGVPEWITGPRLGVANTWTAQNTFNLAPAVPRTDLSAGTSLTIGTFYFDALSANRTLTFSGTPANGQSVGVKFVVTNLPTLTIPSCKRNGEANSAITSLVLTPGVHTLSWTYINAEWILSDTVGTLNKLDGTTAPTANEDTGDGYTVGSVWIDVTNDISYVAVDVTSTAAVWKRTSAGGEVGSFGITIDGGGSAITTGIKGDISIPYACTINSVTLLADQTGSIVVDVWKDTYANYPPTDADTITASAVPTITTATKATDATLTGWTTSVAAGDTIRFNVDSITTITRVNIVIKVTKL